jgi:hypothetical protein
MKNSIFFALIAMLVTTVSANAQITNVWEGGFPGRENDWNCPKNWSLGKTPDVFDYVIIPDVSTTTRRYPVVSAAEVEVASLEVQPGATLTLGKYARILAEKFSCEGTCKGCELRVWIEGDAREMSASSGH